MPLTLPMAATTHTGIVSPTRAPSLICPAITPRLRKCTEYRHGSGSFAPELGRSPSGRLEGSRCRPCDLAESCFNGKRKGGGMGFEDVLEKSLGLFIEHVALSHQRQVAEEAAEARRTARNLRLAMLRTNQDATRLHAEQQQEIAELEFALATLIHLARASGAIDLDAYQEQIRQALAVRDAAAAAQAPRDLVGCANCGNNVSRSQTTITANGVLCDQCHSFVRAA